ncbi:MAG: ATP-grasp domain-containing protein [Gammaproteobacteria bacterium]
MQQGKPCLIIAQSGRALAASAARGGFTSHVLDRFADQDTFATALSCQTVAGDAGGFDVEELLEKLACFLRTPLHGVVYGGGLEQHYDVLAYLNRNWKLLGNEAAVVRACKEPSMFFPMLSRLGISYPETLFTVTPKTGAKESWIIKQTGASGGGHIRTPEGDDHPGGSHYFQKKILGRILSVVFLADAVNATLVGFNEIWAVAPENNDFRYSGAVTVFDLPQPVAMMLEEIVCLLARELGLKGLCGMDVILDVAGNCHVLEINPRPTASFELHQTQCSLYEAHVLACNGRLISRTPQTGLLRAHQVLYADRDFILPEFSWPDWTSDRPHHSKFIRLNEPVCTVHAQAECDSDMQSLLHHRSAALMRLMGLQKRAA